MYNVYSGKAISCRTPYFIHVWHRDCGWFDLTRWGRVTHICVSKLTIIGSDNGLSPGRRQAIIWTNAGILLIRSLGTNFNEILIGIQTFSFKKMYLKVSSGKWRPFCLGLNVLTHWGLMTHICTRELGHWFSWWLVASSARSHCLNKSMGWCKKDITPLLTHWSYAFLAITHRNVDLAQKIQLFRQGNALKCRLQNVCNFVQASMCQTLRRSNWSILWGIGQFNTCWCPDSLRCKVLNRHGIGHAEQTGHCLPCRRISITCAISMLRNDKKY